MALFGGKVGCPSMRDRSARRGNHPSCRVQYCTQVLYPMALSHAAARDTHTDDQSEMITRQRDKETNCMSKLKSKIRNLASRERGSTDFLRGRAHVNSQASGRPAESSSRGRTDQPCCPGPLSRPPSPRGKQLDRRDIDPFIAGPQVPSHVYQFQAGYILEIYRAALPTV